MADRLRGAVVGCGYFAQNHLHAWREISDVDLVAVCDLDREKAERAAREFHVPAVYTDAAAMLAETTPDFVDVITTAETHRPLVELAAQHGVHVICQKPFASTLDDARAMVDACRAAGVKLMVHENFRWQRPMREVKKQLPSIGSLFFGRIYFRSNYDVFTRQPYLATDERFAISDVGVHVLDLARFFFGEAERLTCLTQRINPNIRGEDVATILLQIESGAHCVAEISFASKLESERFPQTLLRLEGTNGSMRLQRNYELTVVSGKHTAQHTVAPRLYNWSAAPGEVIQDSVVAIQRHWVDCLRSGEEPETSGEDNLKTLDLVFGAYQSAETGEQYHAGTLA